MNRITKPGKNLIISFALILIFGVYFFILAYQNKKQAEYLNNWVIHTHLVIEGITKLDVLITEFETRDQSYVITKDESFIKDTTARKLKAAAEFANVKNLTADNKSQQNYLQILQKTLNLKVKYQNNIFAQLKKSHQKALLLLYDPETKRLYVEIKSLLASMLNVENELLKQRTYKYKKATERKFLYSSALSAIALIIVTIAFLKIHKETIRRKIAQEEAFKSEEKYRSLIENSSLIIYTSDLHGRFTYISDKGLELSGYERQDLTGKHFNCLVSENQKKQIERFYYNQYKYFIKNKVGEFEIIAKDSTKKVIQVSAVLIEENGKITGFQSIARDVTEVKFVEGLIKESKVKFQLQQEEYNLRLQSVIDQIPMALYIKDLEGRFITINKKFTELTGLPDEVIIGKTNAEIFPDKEKGRFFDGIDVRIKNTGRPIEFEDTLFLQGKEKYFQVTKFPLFNKSNDIFAISGVAKDITDMVSHRQQLIDSRLKAEKAEQLQEAFLANMSHEIRTPMNGIVGMTNLMLDTSLNAEQKEYAELIKNSSDILLILINDILDLSKIKAGRMELEAIDFSIREVIQNVAQPMKVNLKKGIDLQINISGSLPGFVNGDSHKLFQILNNLLSNAAKFTEKGAIKVSADAIESDDGHIHVQLEVSDSGIGISKDYIKNIFENFTQAGNDTVRRFGGTGLGLAITKRLIELQQGSISVTSTLGAGTVFRVEIPYLPAKTSIVALSANNDDFDTKTAGIKNKKVLIAEDNKVNQRVLTSVLKKFNITWDLANNGKEAVDILRTGNVYDIIIMDLQMPVMNGFEATEYIRKNQKINTPIIAMTASTLQNERARCFNIGMNAYLSKPFSPADLINLIYDLINPLTIKEITMENQQMPNTELFNLDYLYELDDNDYLIEMIELFFETTSEIMEDLQKDIRSKNWTEVYQNAHKLKSSLGPLQVNNMLAITSTIEEYAKNKKNLDQIIYLNKDLNNQYNLVKPMIETELIKAKKASNGYVASGIR